MTSSLYNTEKLRIKPGSFKVSGDGVFYTLQGEGISMGKPACFLRLQLCNLRCGWCDTWYTWNQDTPEFWTESQDWTIEETKEKIEKIWGAENDLIEKRLVITGGEPLLQQNNIEQLLRLLPGWVCEIETNGTIAPMPYLQAHCQFNCSPKLAHSQNSLSTRIKKETLQLFNTLKTIFKFVVKTPEDIEEMEQQVVRPCGIDVTRVVIMPEGTTSEEVNRHARAVVEIVKKKGYRLLGRQHIEIWGKERGV